MMMELPPELEKMMKQLSGALSQGILRGSRNQNHDVEAKGHTMTVKEALPKLEAEEAADSINDEEVIQRAIENVQTNGIVFLDEIDKLAAHPNDAHSRSFRKGLSIVLYGIL
jgi:ATP-dependent HslUV protease ATP-binding subunit HslU